MFSLSLRYSIYKVQCSRLRELLYVITSSELCQVLFSSFFKVFRCALRSRFSPFITQLLYDTTGTFVCQALFSSFDKFSFPRHYLCRPRGQLGYDTTTIPICQALFHKNQQLFLLVFACAHQSLLDRLSLIPIRASPAS